MLIQMAISSSETPAAAMLNWGSLNGQFLTALMLHGYDSQDFMCILKCVIKFGSEAFDFDPSPHHQVSNGPPNRGLGAILEAGDAMFGGTGGQAFLWVQHQNLLPQAVTQILHGALCQVLKPWKRVGTAAHYEIRQTFVAYINSYHDVLQFRAHHFWRCLGGCPGSTHTRSTSC